MILIDMQGYQSFSKKRGIGRYTLNFVKAFLKEKDAYLLFNSNFKEVKEDIKLFKQFTNNIITFSSSKNNPYLEKASELIREKLIKDINPKAVLITSLFEGMYDTSITSIKKFYDIPTAVIFYDLIPLIQKEMFFKNKLFKEWYLEKLENLKRADLLLAISESSKLEAIEYLNFDKEKVVNISSAVDIQKTKENFNKIKEKFNIKKEYIIHVSACDERKNFEGLIKAFGKTTIKNHYQLVFVCNANKLQKTKLLSLAKANGVDLIITGYVNDKELNSLYENAKLLVFPSFHEGFGLPILEAMHFDTPAIGSNTSSIPEVIGYKDALFNPYDIDDMAKKIEEVLTTNLYDKLKLHIKTQREKFSWEKTAKKAIDAISKIEKSLPKIDIYENTDKLIKSIAKLGKTSDNNLKRVAIIIEKNEKEVLKKEIKTIRIEGPFDSSYSLALLNRETAKALKKLGYEVSLYSTEGFGDFAPNKEFLEKNPQIKELWSQEKKEVDLVSRLLYPPRVNDMNGKIKMLHHYAWEESGFVDEWADEFNKNLDCMSLLSKHVKKIMIDNGVSIPMEVSGCGVDHLLNIKSKKIDLPKLKDFVFLHISSCFPRKGVDILLDAYEMAFSKNDNVSLIIKTFPNPHNEIEKLLQKKQKNPNFPHVVLINRDISDEEIKYLYEISDVLVSPSRAEGFGLPVAEAMLEEVGVIITNWGGWKDFCNKENAWLVDFKFEKAKTHFNLFNSVWAEVDRKDLANKMKEAYHTDKEIIKQKAKKGKEKLLKEFKWIDVAKKMIDTATNQIPLNPPKIGWVSTWEVKCGIATYSKHLIEYFSNKPIIFSTYDSLDENSIKSWNTSDKEKSLDNLFNKIIENNIEVLVIQFNYSFFDFKEFNKFLEKLHNKNIKTIIELHSTYDHPAIPEKKLEMIDFSKVKRVIVHNIKDLNRLKDLGYIDNVMLFPHGVLDFESNIKPQKNLIATYGFFLPHKGLIETIKAMKILKEKGYKYKLKMLNAKYPADVSENLINEAKHLIKELNLEKDIELITDFLDDKTCLEEISKSNLVIFAYQETGESASGAVRYALAANRDILMTSLKIFDDVRECGFTLKGFSPEEIAKGIIEYFNKDKKELQKVKEYRKNWLNAHRYSKLSKKLENIIKSIYLNT